MPLEYPLYMLVACFISLMINTYHFYLNSAFKCKRNKDIFRVCYMTSRAIDPIPESARVEKRTVVESLAKFIVLASEISRIIVEAVKVLENIVLCYSESSRELSWNVAKFATNFFANLRAKVRENKERNSRISFALLFHNTVLDGCLILAANIIETIRPLCCCYIQNKHLRFMLQTIATTSFHDDTSVCSALLKNFFYTKTISFQKYSSFQLSVVQ